ncbi:pirin family protein [Nocardioides seonyuensis]|uniref:Pirin family protein n=1 Tax=Nocardioides seonyuensis TaxID=2518371 RepID=A0A4P7IH90_9ACTN|nr:pirin family protein [Nocardioides seonyuensis]QBX55497.1 pirin family protein [Nocardioides seonyuensis]
MNALHRGAARATTTAPGRTTRHSFSFGPHHDPANLGFGPMVCHNDDELDPGAGYPDHPHSHLEIVTWVLEGALVHTSSDGARSVVQAGQAQLLSAGSGVRHSEIADAASGRCRFVQAWLRPDGPGGTTSYSLGEAPAGADGLVEVVGGSALPIRVTGARLLVARLAAGQAVALPEAPLLHVFAATGSARVGGLDLSAGDAARLSDDSAREVSANGPSELLVWCLPR